MTLIAGGRSVSGPRPLNQDWLDWNLPLGLFVVADGMGGHNAGEVASRLAVETIRDFVTESATSRDLTWPFEFDVSQSVNANRLLTAVRLANRRVFSEGAAHREFEGMGTTIATLLVEGQKATVVGVGDSRIYRWRAGQLEQLTVDDTWLADVLGQADADRTDSSHPLKHVLTKVVGTREDLRPLAYETTLQSGDRLLLCSDGVHGRLDPLTIAGILSRTIGADALAGALVDEAIGRRTTDNATALVVVVE
jgi:protein phosphatase